MRPIKLIMRAFGPYANEQIIDFTELKDRNLFLINGRTGSGKTTILDAICFALYGETSGNERKGKSMRSQFAKEDVQTEVELVFKIRDNIYKVDRIPEQEKPKKSGGYTTKPSDAWLYKINGDDETLIEAKANKVTKKIEEIIGFQCNQFRQVIMIPQGQFRQLLTENSENRQEILEKLFHTENYRMIQEFLKQKSKDIRDDIVTKIHDQNIYLNRVKQVNQDESLNTEQNEDIHAKLDKIDELIKQDKGSINELDGLKVQYDKNIKEIQKELNEAVLINKKIDEKNQAEDNLNKINQKRPEIDTEKNVLKNARNALPLIQVENNLVKRYYELKNQKQRKTDLSKQLDSLAIDFEKAKKKFEFENSRENVRIQAENEISELNKFKDAVLELNKLGKEITENKQIIDQEKNVLDSLQQQLNDCTAEKEKLNDEIIKSSALNSDLSNVLNDLKNQQDTFDKLSKLDAMEEKYKDSCIQYEKEAQKLQKAEYEYKNTKNEYEIKQQKWIDGQAGILAAGLQNGKRCPVCGALEHPCPAVKTADVPDEDEIKSLKEKYQTAEKTRDELKITVEKYKIDEKQINVLIVNLKNELGGNFNIDIETVKANIKALKENSEKLRSLLDKNKKDQELVQKLKLKQQKLTERIEISNSEYQKMNTDFNLKKGSLQKLIQQVPENIQTEEKLNEVLKNALKRRDDLKSSFESAENEYDKQQSSLLELKTVISENDNMLDMTQKYYDNEHNEFIEKVKCAGFLDYHEYRKSKLSDAQIDDLDKKINEFDKCLASAIDVHNKLIEETKTFVYMNTDEISNKLKNEQDKKDNVIKNISEMQSRCSDNISILEIVKKLQNQIENETEKYAVIGDLSEAANGKNAYGITFERFVLSILLDDIVIAANTRLLKMSGSRYSLNRTIERERKNMQSGLDLEVFDNYSGAARPVSTLSGGEGFIASLSLALGLADVVQSYSGGISLDTMFIDEGFGSLDPESLDYAIKTLVDLQQNGRLVGIISHVPELKERIDTRLEITAAPDERGSIAKFVL